MRVSVVSRTSTAVLGLKQNEGVGCSSMIVVLYVVGLCVLVGLAYPRGRAAFWGVIEPITNAKYEYCKNMQNESQKKATDHAMMQYVARACPSLAVRVQQYWGCEYRVS